jgi:hypothetical protein
MVDVVALIDTRTEVLKARDPYKARQPEVVA